LMHPPAPPPSKSASDKTGLSPPRKKIAALCSTFHFRSHADNFVMRCLEGYWIGQDFHDPPCEVASLYVDQIHQADVSERVSMAYDIPRFNSVTDAITLGTGELAADAVLIIIEHGDYPENEKLQKLYPRYEVMAEVMEVFRKSGRSVPVYLDKHLSHDWTKAREMYGWSRELGFPMMAGSSLPVTFRQPELEAPTGRKIDEMLVVGGGWYGESWLLHLMEIAQTFAEQRAGGETGIKSVQLVSGIGVWRAALERRWDRSLLDAALARRLAPGLDGQPEDAGRRCIACLIEYRDGLRATLMCLGGGFNFDYLIAMRMGDDNEVLSTAFERPAESADNMSPLIHSIMRMVHTGQPQAPIERTLLTTGALAYLLDSGYRGQIRLETPDLDVSYQAPPNPYFARHQGQSA